MSQETQSPESVARATRACADPAALALALSGASRERADAFLDDQRHMLHLQMEEMRERNPYELSHLRWQRFTDRMKAALQVMTVLVGLAVAAALGAMVWKAAHADGLVVDAFAVSPAPVASGLSADTISEEITERLNGIRREADANSLGISKNVQDAGRDDVRVEIPDTGVSLTQAWRYLKSWLGNERHLRGSLRADGDGRVMLSVSFDGEAPVSFAGPAADLEKLEQQAAEHVYAGMEPINHTIYLTNHGRFDEAMAAVGRMIAIARTPDERAGAYGISSEYNGELIGDLALADAQSRIVLAIAPKSFIGYITSLRNAVQLSHQEDQFRQANAIFLLREPDQMAAIQGRGWIAIQSEARRARDQMLGDYPAVALNPCNAPCPFSQGLLDKARIAALAHDPGASRALIAQALAAKGNRAQDFAAARYGADMAVQDWPAAMREAGAYIAALDTEATPTPGYRGTRKMHFGQPWLAEATARAGDIAGGEALIAVTPLDCDACVLARGRIAALKRDWAGAARWFAMVSARSPHIPLADADWGAMLLARGQADGAVAKFTSANQKGPHFADPLEGWGEALMAQNQSHLALAKFAAAEKYAPNWGRLQLKWGEALVYTGKRAEAAKHLARAAALDLTPSEKSELQEFSTHRV